jgi:hypothetical protein
VAATVRATTARLTLAPGAATPRGASSGRPHGDSRWCRVREQGRRRGLSRGRGWEAEQRKPSGWGWGTVE